MPRDLLRLTGAKLLRVWSSSKFADGTHMWHPAKFLLTVETRRI